MKREMTIYFSIQNMLDIASKGFTFCIYTAQIRHTRRKSGEEDNSEIVSLFY